MKKAPRGVAQFGSASALGEFCERCRWQKKRAKRSAAVKFLRRSKPEKNLGTARGRAKQPEGTKK